MQWRVTYYHGARKWVAFVYADTATAAHARVIANVAERKELGIGEGGAIIVTSTEPAACCYPIERGH